MNLANDEPTEFEMPRGAFRTTAAEHKAAVVELSQRWPEASTIQSLREGVARRLRRRPKGSAPLRDDLVGFLARVFEAGFLRAWLHPPQVVRVPGEQPASSSLARHQARMGASIANRRHENVEVSDAERRLLARLDGRTTRADLADFVEAELASGALTLTIRNGRAKRPTASEVVDRLLSDLARAALISS